MPAHLVHMSPLQKGQVTAAAWCLQRKTLSRIMRTHAAPCIHRGSFSEFFAPSASGMIQSEPGRPVCVQVYL